MRISLGSIGLVALTLTVVGCECEVVTTDDTGTPVDAFVPIGTDTGPRDAGPDAATVTSVCGDGAIEGVEECDDDGVTPGDGCDADCQIETGYSCMGEPSVCTGGCGDSAISGMEACDDGNTTAGDGCSAACAVEMGWTCPAGAPTRGCTSDCGDGVTAVGVEECDDGNATDGDGCDEGVGPDDGAGPAWLPACLTTRCGNAIPTSPETCDDGNTTDGDGCSAMCATE